MVSLQKYLNDTMHKKIQNQQRIKNKKDKVQNRGCIIYYTFNFAVSKVQRQKYKEKRIYASVRYSKYMIYNSRALELYTVFLFCIFLI